MKNIWKNAIYFLSLIGLMTFVTSCGDDGGEDGPSVTTATYVAEPSDISQENVTEPATITGNITIEVSSDGNIVVSGIDPAWNLEPSGFVNGNYTVETFNALGWTSGSVSADAQASVVTLVYDTTPAAAKTKVVYPVYTYVFNRQ